MDKLNVQQILDDIKSGKISAVDGMRLIEEVKETQEIDKRMVFFKENITTCPLLKDVNEKKENLVVIHIGNKCSDLLMPYETNAFETIEAEESTSLMEAAERLKENSNVIATISCSDDQFAVENADVLYNVIKLIGVVTAKNCRIVFLLPEKKRRAMARALRGVALSAGLENKSACIKIIEVSDHPLSINTLCREINDFSVRVQSVVYRDEERFIRKVSSCEPPEVETESNMDFSDGDTCLIIGGSGAIGREIGKHLSQKAKLNVILSGRRAEPTPECNEAIAKISENGSFAKYISADATSLPSVEKLVKKIKKKYGHIKAVVFCAGVLKDAGISNLTGEIFNSVFEKVIGVMQVFSALQKDPPERFVVCSSLISICGNIGQASYAATNGYIDGMLECIEDNSISSINWPLWEIGMGQDIDELSYIHQIGLEQMPINIGMKMLDRALCGIDRQMIFGYGDVERIKPFVEGKNMMIEEKFEKKSQNSVYLHECIKNYLRNKLSAMMRVPASDIKDDVRFGEYGMDSMIVHSFNERMKNVFDGLSKTVLYEESTLNELAEYLILKYPDVVKEIAENKTAETIIESESVEEEKMAEDRDMIAIIGMSGRFPCADDLDQMWKILAEGEECVSEIPPERWSIEEYFDPDITKAVQGKMYSKWGAFLHDVDKFDPLLFGISPKEAESIDPQERVMLEVVWELMENAGYTFERLRNMSPVGEGANIGVFVGVTTNTYQLLSAERWKEDKTWITTSNDWSLANRISYFWNLSGPSIPIDTACSSSLTAVHIACRSLLEGECEAAIVGGVNMYLHPMKYVQLCRLGMLSPSGKCSSFGSDADGFVPGEGCGAVMLKRLSSAQRDGDNILAVIRGTAVNHGGASNGYYVPNPKVQTSLVRNAFSNALVTSDSISYVEAHGTGTELGDPIEISSLTAAFADSAQRDEKCAVGSLKSNMGHMEAAAGIASLIKVVLQLQHGQIVPSLNSKQINPNIDLTKTPFYIPQKLQEWKSSNNVKKRRAGISAFGAGGSNAHVIIEEYPVSTRSEDKYDSYVFVLSAKTDECLNEYVKKMRNWLAESIRLDNLPPLSDIEYTTCVARNSMEERMAVVFENAQSLLEGIDIYLSGQDENFICMVGKEDASLSFKTSIERWCKGEAISPAAVMKGRSGKLTPLPNYAFECRRCWIDDSRAASKPIEVLPQINQRPNKSFEYKKQKSNVVRWSVVDGSIALVEMMDLDNRNMFTNELQDGLRNAFEEIERNDAIKVVVVTGYDNIFCMGGTREQLENISIGKKRCSDTDFAYLGLLQCKIPVISAMQGHAAGGGFVFGLFADIIVLAEQGTYSTNFTQYGFTPGVGCTYILKEKLGEALANEMMYSAQMYNGKQLRERGVNVLVVKDENVVAEAMSIARNIAQKPATTLRTLKNELSSRTLKILPSIIESEIKMHNTVFSQIDVADNIERYFIDSDRNKKTCELKHDEKCEKKTFQSFQESRIDVIHSHDEGRSQTISINMSAKELKDCLMKIVCNVMHVTENDVKRVENFKELGVDSINGVEIIRDINNALGTHIEVVKIYDYPSYDSFCAYLMDKYGISQNDEVMIDSNEEKLDSDEELLSLFEEISENRIDDDTALSLLKKRKNNNKCYI